MLRIGRLPPEEIRRARDFYIQAIDDRVEDGQTEEEAVAALGDMDEIVRQIEDDVPLSAAVRARVEETKKRAMEKDGRWTAWIIAAVTFPLWISLLAVGFSLTVTFWAVSFALHAAGWTVIASGVASVGASVFLPYPGAAPRLMLAGLGLVLAAVGVFLLPVFGLVSRSLMGALRLTFRALKRSILRKGGDPA